MKGSSKHLNPEVLILASRYDLSCDFIVSKLNRNSICYLRLNTEDLVASSIVLDPIEKHLIVDRGGYEYRITSSTLRSVYFRRPVFLRDYGDDKQTPEEQFSRYQWSVFLRNLMIFDEARWVNDPVAIYRAEHKALQLSIAAELGFTVPGTFITNAPKKQMFGQKGQRIAIKGLDTVLIRAEGQESFGFTTFGSTDQIESYEWKSAPATIQEALHDKLDIRVTVVEEDVFAVSISINGKPINDDWRQHKQDVQFKEFCLPKTETELCRKLVKTLGLRFGGIDLAFCHDKFYFLEINPTGEWAWLVDSAGLPIDQAIAHALLR